MLLSPGLAMLFLLSCSTAEECPENCKCVSSSQGVTINCSFRELRKIPLVPEGTTELYLHNNLLTTVAPGTFDKMPNLRTISLHNNPWNCDCRIAYLKQWVQNTPVKVHSSVTCFTPPSVRMKPVAELRGTEYSRCRSPNLYRCYDLWITSIILCLLCLILLFLMMRSLAIIKSKAYIFTPTNNVKRIEYIPLKKRRQDKRGLLSVEFESSNEWPGDDLGNAYLHENKGGIDTSGSSSCHPANPRPITGQFTMTSQPSNL